MDNENAYRKLVGELDKIPNKTETVKVILSFDFYSYLLANYDFVFSMGHQFETIRGFIFEYDHFLNKQWDIRDGH